MLMYVPGLSAIAFIAFVAIVPPVTVIISMAEPTDGNPLVVGSKEKIGNNRLK